MNKILANGADIRMNYVFTARPQQHPNKILCHYINATSKIQVIKIQNPHHFSFERVVFPGQRLFFEALSTDQLEVFSGGIASAILADTLPCSTLQIEGEPIDEASARSMELPLNAN